MRISADSDSEPCPVPDEVLGELYRASKAGLPELIATVSPAARAALALYCYRRGHLKGIGLAIASSCKRHDLETAGGAAGTALYLRAREASPNSPAPTPYVARQKISLATGSLRKSLPIDDDLDEDSDGDAPAMKAANDSVHGAGDDAEPVDTDVDDDAEEITDVEDGATRDDESEPRSA